MANPEVKTKYDELHSDLANLIGFFECELSKEPKELNWATVGNLSKVRRDLMETLSFLSGVSVDEIDETLEISRL